MDKPRTTVFLARLNSAGTGVTVTHVFPDATSIDRHFDGSEERSHAASEVTVPAGWEIYGSPSEAAIENIQAAAQGRSQLTLAPPYVARYVAVGASPRRSVIA